LDFSQRKHPAPFPIWIYFIRHGAQICFILFSLPLVSAILVAQTSAVKGGDVHPIPLYPPSPRGALHNKGEVNKK
jgi:hypothetical protein